MKKVLIAFLLLTGCVLSLSTYADAAKSSRMVRTREDTPILRQIERVGREKGASPRLVKIVKAISCVESSCGRNPVPNREKSKTWERKARKVAKSKRELDELMHSYGSLQLSGIYTLLEFGKSPREIMDDDIGIPVAFEKAAKIFKRCQGSAKCTYARWNGSGEAARKYAARAAKIEENL